jgi:hypothetical protein
MSFRMGQTEPSARRNRTVCREGHHTLTDTRTDPPCRPRNRGRATSPQAERRSVFRTSPAFADETPVWPERKYAYKILSLNVASRGNAAILCGMGHSSASNRSSVLRHLPLDPWGHFDAHYLGNCAAYVVGGGGLMALVRAIAARDVAAYTSAVFPCTPRLECGTSTRMGISKEMFVPRLPSLASQRMVPPCRATICWHR